MKWGDINRIGSSGLSPIFCPEFSPSAVFSGGELAFA